MENFENYQQLTLKKSTELFRNLRKMSENFRKMLKKFGKIWGKFRTFFEKLQKSSENQLLFVAVVLTGMFTIQCLEELMKNTTCIR